MFLQSHKTLKINQEPLVFINWIDRVPMPRH